MTRYLTYVFLIIGLISCGLTLYKEEKIKSGEIEINWVDSLTGDFSFTKNWSYPEGVYKNEFRQLSCDGLCPQETDKMKDDNGKIYEDSLTVFYKLVDTSHQFHSIQSDASTYEWTGTDFVTVIKKSVDTTICYTHKNVGTKSRLIFTIIKDKCIPIIELNSVTTTVRKIYYCKGGQIVIDKGLWKKGILKVNFDFVFDHSESPDKQMYWKGKVYANIDEK